VGAGAVGQLSYFILPLFCFPPPIRCVVSLQYDGAIQFMYANWTVGAPAASCFDVPGAEYCPYGDPDAQCQDFVTKATGMRRAMRMGGIFAGRK